jgi:cyclophilin family peptidyl-prolyl cis-trans isomerase
MTKGQRDEGTKGLLRSGCNLAPLSLCPFVLLLAFTSAVTFAQPARKKNAPPPGAEPTVTPDEAAKLEAVISTDLGEIRFEFFAHTAPQHVAQFIKRARAGFYDGSAFHRMIARAIVQGGDPLLKDAKTSRERWGTGGLSLIKDEFNDVKHVRGTVSAVRIPGKADSGGVQFFICASPQPQLDGRFSAFGQVNEGIEIVDQISATPTDEKQLALTPVKINSIKIEPKKTEPFAEASVNDMRKEVLLHTNLGDITVALDPELAPESVRNFLKLVESRYYDRTAFHRVVPGFVVQGGVGYTRATSKTHAADRWVKKLAGEFSRERKHIRGTLSMARGDDPNSADTSFFIVLRDAPNLDGKYAIFGKVVDGFDTLDRIEQAPRQGETPVERIELIEAVIKP